MWCTCFRSEGFPSPAPSSEGEEVFDVSSPNKKKKTKQTKFIIRITISLKKKHKASSALQSFQAEHRQLLSVSFQIKFGFFSFFNPAGILGSHWALGAFLAKFRSIHNPTLLVTDSVVQRTLGRYSNQPAFHMVLGKSSTCHPVLLEHIAMHQLWPSKTGGP